MKMSILILHSEYVHQECIGVYICNQKKKLRVYVFKGILKLQTLRDVFSVDLLTVAKKKKCKLWTCAGLCIYIKVLLAFGFPLIF